MGLSKGALVVLLLALVLAVQEVLGARPSTRRRGRTRYPTKPRPTPSTVQDPDVSSTLIVHKSTDRLTCYLSLFFDMSHKFALSFCLN